MDLSGTTKIYCGNLPEGCTGDQLRDVFGSYGEIAEASVIKNYAFIHFNNKDDAEKAAKDLNKSKLSGNQISVELSMNQGRNGSKGPEGNGPAPDRRSDSRDNRGGRDEFGRDRGDRPRESKRDRSRSRDRSSRRDRDRSDRKRSRSRDRSARGGDRSDRDRRDDRGGRDRRVEDTSVVAAGPMGILATPNPLGMLANANPLGALAGANPLGALASVNPLGALANHNFGAIPGSLGAYSGYPPTQMMAPTSMPAPASAAAPSVSDSKRSDPGVYVRREAVHSNDVPGTAAKGLAAGFVIFERYYVDPEHPVLKGLNIAKLPQIDEKRRSDTRVDKRVEDTPVVPKNVQDSYVVPKNVQDSYVVPKNVQDSYVVPRVQDAYVAPASQVDKYAAPQQPAYSVSIQDPYNKDPYAAAGLNSIAAMPPFAAQTALQQKSSYMPAVQDTYAAPRGQDSYGAASRDSYAAKPIQDEYAAPSRMDTSSAYNAPPAMSQTSVNMLSQQQATYQQGGGSTDEKPMASHDKYMSRFQGAINELEEKKPQADNNQQVPYDTGINYNANNAQAGSGGSYGQQSGGYGGGQQGNNSYGGGQGNNSYGEGQGNNSYGGGQGNNSYGGGQGNNSYGGGQQQGNAPSYGGGRHDNNRNNDRGYTAQHQKWN